MDEIDDIPVAARDTAIGPRPTPATPVGWWRWLILAILSGAGLGAGVALRGLQTETPTANSLKAAPAEAVAPSNSANASAPSPTATGDTLLNHYKYPEAPQAELIPISADGGILMRKPAAESFAAMVAAAQAEGVSIVPLSGFRTIAEQRQLYFDIKAERGQTAKERAAWSAPPGYSEHHTGYVIDIGDGGVPALNLNPEFEKTPAFSWMEKHGAKYSFELSFPKGNDQGVSYEPWHWRYVGDQASLEMFYKVRK